MHPFAIHKFTTITSLYRLQVRYLLSTQQQLSGALREMIAGAHDQEIKEAFHSHLLAVSLQRERLEQILIELTSEAKDAHCAITSAMISSVKKIIRETDRNSVRDAWLVASAHEIESFVIASYQSAIPWASSLGYTYHVVLLQKTLDEELHADGVLRDIERRMNSAYTAV
jgi:ferritin-like metal-binding protein YciE